MFKEAVKYVLIGFIGLAVTTGGLFFFGKLDNTLLATVEKERANIKREVFKESKSYVEGMIEDLSNYKREFERAEDINEKEQIANMVDAEFSNFDINKIENQNLYSFLSEIRNGAWR
ncbi:MAG: hypothetical protein ACLRSF_06805 [Romboutsia timonensis]|uniref:hypothetical protein n=1 Tax=Romboutsia timonensis TaxID=1776391 RepID=UPI00399094E1